MSSDRIVAWSHRDEDPVASYALPIKGVYALAFSADTRRLAQTGADGKVRIFVLRWLAATTIHVQCRERPRKRTRTRCVSAMTLSRGLPAGGAARS